MKKIFYHYFSVKLVKMEFKNWWRHFIIVDIEIGTWYSDTQLNNGYDPAKDWNLTPSIKILLFGLREQSYI